MTTYKISYVVQGEDHPGAIVTEWQRPEVGQRVMLGHRAFVVVELRELIPPRGDFAFFHATLAPASAETGRA